MLNDLSMLNGIDFSKKYVNSDGLRSGDLDNILSKQKNKCTFDLPSPISDNSTVDDFPDLNYAILYAHYLGDINSQCYIFINVNADEIERRRFQKHVINIAINSGHLIDMGGNWGLDVTEQDLNYFFNMEELKDVLYKYKLKRSGNKSVLISRITENLTQEQINYEFPPELWDYQFKVTESGIDYVKRFKYIEMVPFNFTFEEYLLLCEKNPQYSSKDIIFCLCYQDWLQLGENRFSTIKLLNIDEINRYCKQEFMESFYSDSEYIIPLYEKIISGCLSGDIGFYKEEFDVYMKEVACEPKDNLELFENEANKYFRNYEYEKALEYYLKAQEVSPLENHFQQDIELCKEKINKKNY
ncbi:MAG: hypothetical protein E7Z81_07275 [Methanobrevibacter sp.]|uniref:SAP domain-containing protein n=1 Tax=Methanobrevibacter sp. TaxID=66852 RepID=UPI0026006BE0|nr:SAP domain-containing protein [Methanobrevibacter sp.]MBE6498061.1 hypothetical protein [Methanobrevibacter sp.]MBE6499350.1 hypothetical protein [Methanobrevibacter thaueri]